MTAITEIDTSGIDLDDPMFATLETWSTGAETHAQSMRDAADLWTDANAGTAERFNRYGQTAV